MPYLKNDIIGVKRNIYALQGDEVTIISSSPPAHIVQHKENRFAVHESELSNTKLIENEAKPLEPKIRAPHKVKSKGNKVQPEGQNDLYTSHQNTLF